MGFIFIHVFIRAPAGYLVVTACPFRVWVLTVQHRAKQSTCPECSSKADRKQVYRMYGLPDAIKYYKPKKGRIKMTEVKGSGEMVRVCCWVLGRRGGPDGAAFE